ncbi:unnamed protein product [Cylindrotheca closterium]|uniref:Mitochondrial ornithine carrier protein n=1 Tax=Cylindrotheca closterium TaxID=2856 RepID=A0AAD2JKB4_9STRA|nr:unnamed protein product [Cylindrotheca closterium]
MMNYLYNLSEPTKDFIAGTTAGFVVKVLDHPFDTVKVLLQTQSTESPTYRNAWHCLESTARSEAGFMSLYRGISSPLLGSMAENAICFWGYSHCKAFLGESSSSSSSSDGKQLSIFELALAGGGAGVLVPLVNTPVELIKCRLQVQIAAEAAAVAAVGGAAAASAAGPPRFTQYKGPIDVMVQTIKNEGLFRGLYRGNVSTLAREVPGNFVWFGTYETICHSMIPEGGTKADLSPAAHWLGGAMAGAGYWTAFYPADTVKSMIQTTTTSTGKNGTESSGMLKTFATIYKQQGIRGLYRGWGVTVMRAAPGHGFIFVVYEYTQKLLKGNHE